jgi:hypothetical protein
MARRSTASEEVIRMSQVGALAFSTQDPRLEVLSEGARVEFRMPLPTPLRPGSRITVEMFGPDQRPWWLRWLGLAWRDRAYNAKFVVTSITIGRGLADLVAIDLASYERHMSYEPQW